MTIKAILLDLDNTLVIFDETQFYLQFMKRIIPLFEDLMTGEQFSERLLPAIRFMRKNDGTINNEDFFMNAFCKGIENQRDEIWNRFIHFYENEYENIPVDVEKPADLEATLDQLKAWRLKLVVATRRPNSL